MMGGEKMSQEQGTSDTINAASASIVFPGDSLVKLNSSSAMVVSLQLPRRLRELVSGRRVGRSIS